PHATYPCPYTTLFRSLFDPDTVKDNSYKVTVRSYNVLNPADHDRGHPSYYGTASSFGFTGELANALISNEITTNEYYQCSYTGTDRKSTRLNSSHVKI